MRQELKASWKWQPGCFDRLLRSGDSLHEKWLYVQENPVRAGLVQHWEDWPYRHEFNELAGYNVLRTKQHGNFDPFDELQL
jgi:hypothetical protein